jgi:hypothetical protein
LVSKSGRKLRPLKSLFHISTLGDSYDFDSLKNA